MIDPEFLSFRHRNVKKSPMVRIVLTVSFVPTIQTMFLTK